MQTKKSITSAVLAVLSNLAFAAAFHGCTGQVDVKFPSGSAGENNSSDESTPQNDSGEPEKEQGGTPTPNVTPTVTPNATPIPVDGSSAHSANFKTLESELLAKVRAGGMHGYAVQVYDKSDTLLWQSQTGVCGEAGFCPRGNQPFTVTLSTSVASGSKWITSTTVLAALDTQVRLGKFQSVAEGLELKVSAALAARCGGASKVGRGASITLRQLLSFTSGLIPDNDCTTDRTTNIQSCACKILSESAAAEVSTPSAGSAQRNSHPPSTTYKYGGAHQLVAAAMIELATGQSFPILYKTLVKDPIGLTGDYTNPNNLSGGYWTSVSDYAKFVRAIFHSKDPTSKLKILSFEATNEQEKSQMPPGVVYRMSPQKGLEYGLNTWRWCYKYMTAEQLLDPNIAANPTEAMSYQDTSCTQVHQQGHGGKGGYHPFIDRKRGMYGVFSMREASAGGGADYEANELNTTALVRLYSGLVVENLNKK